MKKLQLIEGKAQEPSDLSAINRPQREPHGCLSWSYFARDAVALADFVQYFLHQTHEERKRSEKPMKL